MEDRGVLSGPLCKADEILSRLKRSLPAPSPERFVALYAARFSRRLFPILVGVILSQNTSDRNAIEAYRRLVDALGGELTPEKVLEAPLEKLIDAIKPAGMYKRRVESIRAVAEWLARHPDIEEKLCKMPIEKARSLLMRLPGVGPKTADVTLMNYCGFPLFPIDTHIARILERWGVKGNYEEKRRWAESFFPPDARREAHMLLIELGRLYCRPGRPKCGECPLRDCCPYALAAGREEAVSASDSG